MEIKAENLTKNYSRQEVVKDLSFKLSPGEILGFLGPNGAGKSTTLKMLAGYLAPTSGKIFAEGKDIAEHPLEYKAKIGYLPENTPVYPQMFILDYLVFMGRLQGLSPKKADASAREMIRFTGLEKERKKKIGALSKGYRQRVGLAQALVHDPEVLYLDEPTTGLDPNQIIEIRELIRELGKTKTILLSTHLLPEAEYVCDKVMILNMGKIAGIGTSEELGRNNNNHLTLNIKLSAEAPPEKILLELNNAPSIKSVSRKNQDTFTVQSEVNKLPEKEIFRICEKNGWYILRITEEKNRLEEIFKNLTN